MSNFNKGNMYHRFKERAIQTQRPPETVEERLVRIETKLTKLMIALEVEPPQEKRGCY